MGKKNNYLNMILYQAENSDLKDSRTVLSWTPVFHSFEVESFCLRLQLQVHHTNLDYTL